MHRLRLTLARTRVILDSVGTHRTNIKLHWRICAQSFTQYKQGVDYNSAANGNNSFIRLSRGSQIAVAAVMRYDHSFLLVCGLVAQDDKQGGNSLRFLCLYFFLTRS